MRCSERSSSQCGSALTSSTAPSRGGSISALSSGRNASIDSCVASNRFAVAKRVRSVEAVRRSILSRAGHQRVRALDAEDVRAEAGDRQREVAQPAEEVGDAFPGCRDEQRHRAAYQHAVHRMVHLREFGGAERHGHAELRQRVGERRAGRMEWCRGRRAAGLQPDVDGVLLREGAKARAVVGTERLENAEHQRVDGLGVARFASVRGTFADRDFDLRHAVADRQAFHQATQPRQQVRDLARQHVTLAHVGDVARLALVEADQHAALLRNVAHRQPCAIPIAPGRAVHRGQEPPGRDAAEARERLLEHALLRRDLQCEVGVLQRASATGAEVRAARRDTRGTRREHARRARDLVGGLAFQRLDRDALARQRALDEYRLAVDARDAAAFVVERLDGDGDFAHAFRGRPQAATMRGEIVPGGFSPTPLR